MSAYRTAIDQTTRTLEKRARYYHNLIIAVVVIGLGSSVSAFVGWSFVPLLGLLAVIPACGAFFFADGRLLDGWRAELLESWVGRHIDLTALRAVVLANPTLPKGTMESMLATLPFVGDFAEEQHMSASTRQAIGATTLAMHRAASDTIALKTAATALAVAAILAAATLRRWEPLVVLASLAFVPVAESLTKRRHLDQITDSPPPPAH